MRAIGWLLVVVGLYLLGASAIGVVVISMEGHAHEWFAYLSTFLFGIGATGAGALLLALAPESPTAAPASADPPAAPTSSPKPVSVVLLILAAFFGAILLVPMLGAALKFLGAPELILALVSAAQMLVPAVVVIVLAVRRVRESKVPWDRHLLSYVFTQSLRLGFALAIVVACGGGAAYLPYAISPTLAMVTLGTGIGLLLWFAGTALGMLLAWLFLSLTRVSRNRTIGEIARENAARAG